SAVPQLVRRHADFRDKKERTAMTGKPFFFFDGVRLSPHALELADVAIDDVPIQLLLAVHELGLTVLVADIRELLERELAVLEVRAFAVVERRVTLLAHLLER